MKTNKAALDIIRLCEGLKLEAYICPGGKWTIGYGHTGGVREGDTITKEAAEKLLLEDVETREIAVKRYIMAPLSENQFSALVSLTYNIGAHALEQSTLRRKLNSGDYRGAADEFDRWKHSRGKVLEGLVKRRRAEKDLFLKGMNQD